MANCIAKVNRSDGSKHAYRSCENDRRFCPERSLRSPPAKYRSLLQKNMDGSTKGKDRSSHVNDI
jgi:hypothetical protein